MFLNPMSKLNVVTEICALRVSKKGLLVEHTMIKIIVPVSSWTVTQLTFMGKNIVCQQESYIFYIKQYFLCHDENKKNYHNIKFSYKNNCLK